MRNVSVALRVVAVVAVFSVSAVGQQILIYPDSTVDLPIEPVRLHLDMTLAQAAQRNDFPAFETLYNERRDPAFTELHDFWKWSLTDPIGAFYGADTHAKLAARYRDYAPFIADYTIVDSHGRSFYPSSETRQFLLRHAMLGTMPVLAKKTISPLPTGEGAAVARSATHPRVRVVSTTPKPVVRALPAPTKVVAAQPKPVLQAKKPALPAPPPVVDRVDQFRFARGLALIIAGLIGVGMLTTMLRTPTDEKEGGPEAMRIIKLEHPKNDPGSHSSVA